MGRFPLHDAMGNLLVLFIKMTMVLVAEGLVNHKMTKALEGAEVGIRMRCVNKLGHLSRLHLNIFLSHHFVLLLFAPISLQKNVASGLTINHLL